MKQLLSVAIVTVLFACATPKRALVDSRTFLLTERSTDSTYGYSQLNAVQVGGANKSEGPLNERRFLNALAGPKGELVSYYRAGSCCAVKSNNGFMGMAMLDKYRVTWEDSDDTVTIFINMYDYGELKAPVGFTIKSNK